MTSSSSKAIDRVGQEVFETAKGPLDRDSLRLILDAVSDGNARNIRTNGGYTNNFVFAFEPANDDRAEDERPMTDIFRKAIHSQPAFEKLLAQEPEKIATIQHLIGLQRKSELTPYTEEMIMAAVEEIYIALVEILKEEQLQALGETRELTREELRALHERAWQTYCA